MNLNVLHKLMLAALLSAATGSASAQTNAVAPADFSAFSRFIAERNIFNPNRTPHRAAPVRPQPARQPDWFSFTGVMSYDKGEFAFFDGSNSQFRKVAQVDDEIAGFTIKTITPEAVTLVRETNTVVLKMGWQMRDDDGHWINGGEAAGNSSGSSANYSGRNRNGSRRRNGGSRFSESSNNSGNQNTGDAGVNNSNGEAGDALAVLMRRRAQELGTDAAGGANESPAEDVVIPPPAEEMGSNDSPMETPPPPPGVNP